MELAQAAFFTENFDLAVEIYERYLKENGPTFTLFIGLANSYARAGNLPASIDCYKIASKLGELGPDHLDHLVVSLLAMLGDNEDIIELTTEKFSREAAAFCCDVCKALWRDPVTIQCGHTFCRKCLSKEPTHHCKTCSSFNHYKAGSLGTNVALQKTTIKWFPDEVEAGKLQERGNQLFNDMQYNDAITAFTEAKDLVPHDHISASNRSFAYATINRFQEALEDAQLAVDLRPDWPKGYYRVGKSLMALNRHQDASVTFLKCLLLDPTVKCAESALKQCLYKIFSAPQPDDLKMKATTSQTVQQRLSVEASTNPLNIPTEQLFTELQSENKTTQLGSFSIEAVNKIKDSLKEHLKRIYEDPPDAEAVGSSLHRRHIPQELLDETDFECTLCYRLYYEPVTTPCGHVFCKQCLERSLDHNANCPLCKASLVQFLAERIYKPTQAIEQIIKTYFPHEMEQRNKQYHDEIAEIARMGQDTDHEIPVFVCTLAFPTVQCPLHIFEPRYRLMIRQCMEAGTRQFGMCSYDQERQQFSNYGTMLEIREVQYFPDGRSVVSTVGGRRFKVLSRGMKNGYNTATVEFLSDVAPPAEAIQDLDRLLQTVYTEGDDWFKSLPSEPMSRILQHFGSLPEMDTATVEQNNGPSWCWWLIAVLPLDSRAHLTLLSMTSIRERLLTLRRVLNYVKRSPTQ